MMPEGHFHRSRIAQLDEDEEDEEPITAENGATFDWIASKLT